MRCNTRRSRRPSHPKGRRSACWERCPAGRRGNPRRRHQRCCTAVRCLTGSVCDRRFPLCHWRDISPWRGESLLREPLPLGEVPGRAVREPTRSHRACLRRVAVRDAFSAELAGSPSVTGVTSPPEGENRHVREPLPLGEVPGRAEREPTRRHRSRCTAVRYLTRSMCDRRFPLCHWRDISPGGGESACARTSPLGRGARQGGEGTHAKTPESLHRREVRDAFYVRLAGSPSVTGVTSHPVGENRMCANLSPWERCPVGRRGNPREHIELVCGAVQCGTRSGCNLPVPPLSLA